MKDSRDGIVLLAADDDSAFSELLALALEKAKIEAKTVYISDGREVIDYLEGKGRFADRTTFPLPHLATLDIKMPRMTGLEALSWIRQDHRFKSLPVMVLSSSSYSADTERAKELKANVYVVKPFTVVELSLALKAFFDAWLPKLSVRSSDKARPRA